MNDAVNGLALLHQQDDKSASARDHAPRDPHALQLQSLERWMGEIQNQPAWRREADKAVDYYDGNQLDADTIQRLDSRGLGPLVTNLIKPTVDAVLGMEAKTRTDWRVGADDEQHTEVAEALSAKIHEAEREANADMATSEAYAQQIKAGFGCVEVSRDSNPFNYPYRVESVHRREIYWDWRSKKLDWSDARYVVRRRWYDADHLASFFPEHADLIRFAGHGWRDWADFLTVDNRVSLNLAHGLEQERVSWDDYEWRDTERGRVSCFEVWYRVWIRGLVLRLPGGRVIEFDQADPQHRAIVATGMVQPKVAVYDKVRVAFHIGPHRVRDIPTNRRRFPYVPFWGYREDLTGVPYGLIRSMLSPQDELNARAQKMMWLLSARRTQIDSDALDEKYNTLSDASREMGMSDAFIVTNPMRKGGQAAIRVDENMQLSQFQFQIMQERKQAIQEAAGVYSAMMGQQSNASSGLAIQSLVEQGTTTLAEINDNYRYARRGVGSALLDLLKEDMIDQTEIMVDTGMTKKRVMVNIPMTDDVTGQQYKRNDVQSAPVKIALSDVPSTPTYRAQQFGQFAEILKSLPPQQQALLVPFALEMSDFAHRKDMAKFLREQMGIQLDQDSPEAKQQQQAVQQAQAAQAELAMRDAESKIEERQARTRKLLAEAEKAARDSGNDQLADRLGAAQAELEKIRLHEEAETGRAAMREQGETERALIAAATAGQPTEARAA